MCSSETLAEAATFQAKRMKPDDNEPDDATGVSEEQCAKLCNRRKYNPTQRCIKAHWKLDSCSLYYDPDESLIDENQSSAQQKEYTISGGKLIECSKLCYEWSRLVIVSIVNSLKNLFNCLDLLSNGFVEVGTENLGNRDVQY